MGGRLRDVRESVGMSAVELAKRLGIGRSRLLKLERQSDYLASTLRRYIEALGGSPEVWARFYDRETGQYVWIELPGESGAAPPLEPPTGSDNI